MADAGTETRGSVVDLRTENADLKAENLRRLQELDRAGHIKSETYRKAELTDYLIAENKRLEVLNDIRKDTLLNIALGADNPSALATNCLSLTQKLEE